MRDKTAPLWNPCAARIIHAVQVRAIPIVLPRSAITGSSMLAEPVGEETVLVACRLRLSRSTIESMNSSGATERPAGGFRFVENGEPQRGGHGGGGLPFVGEWVGTGALAVLLADGFAEPGGGDANVAVREPVELVNRVSPREYRFSPG